MSLVCAKSRTNPYRKPLYTSASTQNTTASSIRSGSVLAGFFSTDFSYGIFAYFTAGQYLEVNFGGHMLVKTVTYRNGVASQWAPYTVQIRASDNRQVWTTLATHTDSGGHVDADNLSKFSETFHILAALSSLKHPLF